jgi:hypothetical protein
LPLFGGGKVRFGFGFDFGCFTFFLGGFFGIRVTSVRDSTTAPAPPDSLHTQGLLRFPFQPHQKPTYAAPYSAEVSGQVDAVGCLAL